MAEDGQPELAAGLERLADLQLPEPAEAARLTRVLQTAALSLARRETAQDRALLRRHSQTVMAVAGQLDATRLFLMAEDLHDRAGDPDCTDFTASLTGMRDLLHPLILSLQAGANTWRVRS